MDKANTKPEDQQKKDLPNDDGKLSPEDLEKVAGGTGRSGDNDPCEGGQYHSK